MADSVKNCAVCAYQNRSEAIYCAKCGTKVISDPRPKDPEVPSETAKPSELKILQPGDADLEEITPRADQSTIKRVWLGATVGVIAVCALLIGSSALFPLELNWWSRIGPELNWWSRIGSSYPTDRWTWHFLDRASNPYASGSDAWYSSESGCHFFVFDSKSYREAKTAFDTLSEKFNKRQVAWGWSVDSWVYVVMLDTSIPTHCQVQDRLRAFEN